MWWVEVTVTMPSQEGMRKIALAAYEDFRNLEGILNPEMGGALGDHRLEFSMVVPLKDRQKAERKACAAVRSALHAAGAATPDWDRLVDEAIDRSSRTTAPARELASA